MSTPTPDTRSENEPSELAGSQPQQESAELVELEPISATQGGLLGNKYDTGLGWQYS